ncbi:MAG: 16S rRNA (guanine(966)-N(2))-methyltransferase RsmD [Christensenellaceae bacterium]|nr:16S rRNA (guanine(966)-N(2))-methyltransferase RsmD [Christensenellaceae bacterium]
MRIIAGAHRGRKLQGPPGETTRPTLGRAREALFSILGAALPGAMVLDAFAGSGALGLEALSRGAAFCCFCEQDPAALGALRANIAALRFECSSGLCPGDFFLALPRFRRESPRFSLAFLDPPYASGLLEPSLSALRDGILAPGALVVCEAERGTALCLPPGFEQVTERVYGRNALWIYRLAPQKA